MFAQTARKNSARKKCYKSAVGESSARILGVVREARQREKVHKKGSCVNVEKKDLETSCCLWIISGKSAKKQGTKDWRVMDGGRERGKTPEEVEK